jgi:hypothetical protein
MDSDNLLQESRRLDWRFLLPRADLNQVAYYGPKGSPLAESLKQFSGSFTRLEETTDLTSGEKGFDVLVMVDPIAGDIRKWSGFLLAKGSLYIENHGFTEAGWWTGTKRDWGNRPGRTINSFWRILSEVREVGFQCIQKYWLWPNFEAATRVIPLDEEYGLRYLISRGRGGRGAVTAGKFIRTLVKANLLQPCVPCLSILAVGRREPALPVREGDRYQAVSPGVEDRTGEP